MKRNLLLLAVMVTMVFGFYSLSAAQCPEDPNDLGECDTLRLEAYGPDTVFTPPGPADVRVPLFVTHDDNTQPDGNPDSISAFILPLCFTYSNTAANVTVDPLKNHTNLYPFPDLDNSIFQHLPDMATETISNWMMTLSEDFSGRQWDQIILNLDGDPPPMDVFWLAMFPAGSQDQRFGGGQNVLLSTITFTLEDSTMLCIDSCFWPPSSRLNFIRSDAVSYFPRTNMPFCRDYYIIPNLPPYFDATCGGGVDDYTHSQNGAYTTDDFCVTDDDGTIASVVADVATLPGVANIAVNLAKDSRTGNVTYDVVDHCQAGGQVTLTVTDDQGAQDTDEFTITLTNDPPTITCPVTGTEYMYESQVFDEYATANDPEGYALTFSGTAPGWLTIEADGRIHGTAPDIDDTTCYTVVVTVEDDCGAVDDCTFEICVTPVTNWFVRIPQIEGEDCVEPGAYVELPIEIAGYPSLGGFELEIEFEYTSLCFVGAKEGTLLPDGWEKFTYRLLPCPIPPCQKYKILAFGMWDIPDGVLGEYIEADADGATFEDLVILQFVVMNDQNLRGYKIPVCWEWEPCDYDAIPPFDPDCGENTFSSPTGDTLYVSSLEECQFDAECCDDPGGQIQANINFQADPINPDPSCFIVCGGILVCPLGPEQCKRGDVNMNTVTYEVADAVLFANYFVYGTSVFIHDMDYQICATDVNADGRTLTLSDLIYLIRVILHDAVEIPPKLAPASEAANVIVSNNTITVDCDAPVAAMLFEFDGAVQPTLLADMEMEYNDNKVLVWSRNGYTMSTAEVISFSDAELVSVSAVDYDTRILETNITAKAAPSSFALHAAYPNPFNPAVNLSFTLPEAMNYSMNIYNVAGQLVRSYESVGSAGLNVVTWDGKDNAGVEVSSGVYFYKLMAAGFSATEKMVMMK
jgi:hypothetical protein